MADRRVDNRPKYSRWECLAKCGQKFLLAVGSGLTVEGFKVILDGVRGQLKAPRDLLDGVSLEEEAQLVDLPRGEVVPGGHGWQQLISRGRLHDDSHSSAAERTGGQADPTP